MTDTAQNPWAAWFELAEQHFSQGRFSSLWSMLQAVDERDIPEARRARTTFFRLTCAVYGVGDLDTARAVNRALDFRFHPTIRYRLCLRLGDYATARRLRKAHAWSENERADFRYTLGLHCLTRGRYTTGFEFYQERHRAINTPRSLPAALTYHTLTDDPGEDPPLIVLEQGMGEVLISLQHIKASGGHAQSTFLGMPKYRRFVQRYFPGARYVSRIEGSGLEGQPAILAVDFLKRAWHARRSLAPGHRLDTPIRGRHSRPAIGICWRGGSAQNRREERHIPLPFFVEFLPRDRDYVVLQYDLTEEEKAFLSARPNIRTPLLDLTDDALATYDLVRELAGVISVAGANWHLAGSAGIPLLAIMHDTPHWLWGRPADARSVYPSATTLDKAALSHARVKAWSDTALAAWPSRALTVRASGGSPADRPVFLTGMPGPALAETLCQLADRGLWTGTGDGSAPADTDGDARIGQRLIFHLLRKLGAHEDGIVFPPDPDRLPPYPWLRFQIERALREQGWDGVAAWGLQDFRLALLWPLFARAYPDARWVIVEQAPDQVSQHLVASPRFARHSTSPEYWQMFLNAFEDRLAGLRDSGEQVLMVDPAMGQAPLDVLTGAPAED